LNGCEIKSNFVIPAKAVVKEIISNNVVLAEITVKMINHL
jgi:hypothetical protein